ncbi:MAG TPA: substrate-binding domain-containing protein [Candidatus Avanaerovorax faecigallinarum]|nr:substrate-binding domain-containing protein [Candidatus Avanaerovorax faecigallinarum]
MKLKKLLAAGMIAVLAMGALTACGGNDEPAEEEGGDTAAAMTGDISVLTREDGSGTRGAFIELFGIEGEDGTDNTIAEAEVTNSTSVMMQTVSGNKQAIGYVSLGSLDESLVKALKVDGVEATADNVKSGDYKVSRPFNIVTKGDVSAEAQDFINFIMSEEGQAVAEEEGYISEGNQGAFEGGDVSGTITVSGSSSVTPLMEKLKEAYNAVNPDLEIEIQQSDSTTGVTDAINGISDIGMASRELKDDETSQGITGTVIALDGIAVIVNSENPIDDIASDMITKIYTGEVTAWDDVK